MKRICEKRRTMEGATENGMMLCGPRVATHSLFLYSSQSSSLEDDAVRTELDISQSVTLCYQAPYRFFATGKEESGRGKGHVA